MNYISCDMNGFINKTRGKQVLCFGGGSYFKVMCCDIADSYPDIQVMGIIDNDPSRCGNIIEAKNFKASIYSLEKAASTFDLTKTAILITSLHDDAIKNQLNNSPVFNDIDVFSYLDIKLNGLDSMEANAIPKTIHYCWFGGGDFPDPIKKCMETWQVFAPDYTIKCWNEKNVDFNKNKYLQTTYAMKKWSKIANYIRLLAVYENGGMYFDTDVELLRSPNILRYNQGFMATTVTGAINTGSGFGAIKHNPIIKKLMERIESQEDILSYISSTNTGHETEFFYDLGYRLNGQLQVVEGFTIYPYYIMPSRHKKEMIFNKDVSISIHHEFGSWR
ncbi:MAG: hypothetical protein FWC16_05805 [Defluviitaleaceae bacterium]|nr:hypothetical protein [Defluviitaleaceae bacterium]MCL2274422.1 hypothetical protein [Defluviitaleaceae bacterium]